ncbi:hypothetical protein Pla52o_13890 [Novipirellula galeiformis]|uniref:Sulfatase n=1 Tax=Novipirellula galeiformis TaxID=2528004 RepID=A0A5C6CNY4_9BACT|nr:DUF1501 domain-containing protein [Novipirellula galeiformis]TWU25091.1 hypothetical protein Pla52o_13890 [Novipirellula galeiformis]
MVPKRMNSPRLHEATRRHFFSRCTMGVGSMALASLMADRGLAAPTAATATSNPMQPKAAHFPAKAKNVIFLFMAGGPTQFETFEYKPKLTQWNGQPIPPSFVEGKRFAFMDSSHRSNLLGPTRTFKRYGESDAWVSDLLPHTAQIVDELTIVKTCKTELFNHAPAKLFMNTGSGQFGRPAMGSWVTYGLGSECDDLPGFLVLQSGPRGPRGGAVLWGSGVLPTTYQGVPLRSQGDPILNLSTPGAFNQTQQRALVDAVRELNLKQLVETSDPEIATRINAYELAYRMQSSAPELMDTAGESAETLAMYGIKDPNESSYARNCLLARRLVERGVRFIQLYHTNWDHHGGPTENLQQHLPEICKEVDQASAALVMDLKRRGLLEDTIVIWGGEFGRTPMGEVRENTGRNHHIDAFTMWFAGGGFKPGLVYGETDEFGFGPIENPVHVHDLHATLLHLLGLDHQRLSVRFQGLDFRLTGVDPAHVVKDLLA